VGVTETGRRAKFYRLTKAGSKQFTAEEEGWDRLALAIAKVRKAVFRVLMTLSELISKERKRAKTSAEGQERA
jgi:DNA-binding PadR family transcriptional regulator